MRRYRSYNARHSTVQKVVTRILVTCEECLCRNYLIFLARSSVNVSSTSRAHSFWWPNFSVIHGEHLLTGQFRALFTKYYIDGWMTVNVFVCLSMFLFIYPSVTMDGIRLLISLWLICTTSCRFKFTAPFSHVLSTYSITATNKNGLTRNFSSSVALHVNTSKHCTNLTFAEATNGRGHFKHTTSTTLLWRG